MKTCTGCKKEFPATTDYFQKQKQSKDGLSWRCKQCLKVYEKRRYWKHRDKRLNEVKEYYQENKEKVLEYQSQYYKENKEMVNKRNKVYRIKHREKLTEYSREYYQKHKLQHLIRARKYRKTPKGRQVERSSWQRKRKDLKNSIKTLTLEDWENTLAYFNHECAYCGISNEPLQQEHVIPLIKGGHYTKQNIIPACKSCNASKCDNDLEVWFPKRESYTKQRLERIHKWIGYNKNKKQQQLALF